MSIGLAREQTAFRSSTTCAPKASPTISRCRCCSSTARSTPSSWTTQAAGRLHRRTVGSAAHDHRALCAARRDHQLCAAPPPRCSTPMSATAPASAFLAGQIRRGHAEAMQAAIWLSDLRGFTALSDRLPAETVVDILNQYFDCQVAAIRAHGGEVLKYMGDGLLAVFPIDEYVGDAQQVCSRVLEAAREFRAPASPTCNTRSGTTIERFRFGVALHVGQHPLRQYRRRQPARLHLHRPRQPRAGWKRSPPLAAPSWLGGFAGIAGGWSDSANSRSPVSRRRVFGCRRTD